MEQAALKDGINISNYILFVFLLFLIFLLGRYSVFIDDELNFPYMTVNEGSVLEVDRLIELIDSKTDLQCVSELEILKLNN